MPSLLAALVILAGTGMLLWRAIAKVRHSRRFLALTLFGFVLLVAIVIGIRFGVFGEFQIGERIRIQGVPVPLVVFVLEGDNWKDFVKPPLVGYLCMVANAVFPVGVVSMFWILGLRFFRRNSAPQIA